MLHVVPPGCTRSGLVQAAHDTVSEHAAQPAKHGMHAVPFMK